MKISSVMSNGRHNNRFGPMSRRREASHDGSFVEYTKTNSSRILQGCFSADPRSGNLFFLQVNVA